MADTIDNNIKKPTQQKSTGFTNIQNVVAANRQNRLGQTVSGGVSNIINKNQQDLSQAKNQFQEDANKNQMGTEADKSFVNQTIANPDASQANVDQFAKFRAGQYSGPTQLSNQDKLNAQGQDLQGLANAGSDEYGRRGLLQRFVAPNQYTQGQQRMDNLLLGQTGGQALNQARRQGNLYGQQLNQAEQAAAAQGQGFTQQAKQFGEDVTNQLGQAQTGQETDLNNRVAQSQSQSDAARKALMLLLQKPGQATNPGPAAPAAPAGSMTTMPVHGLREGLTQAEYDNASKAFDAGGMSDKMMYNPEFFTSKPEDIVGQNAATANTQNVANEQDKSKALALAKLAGNQSSLFTDQSQVGGYDPLGFLDKKRFDEATANSKKSREQMEAAQQAQGTINDLLGSSSDYGNDQADVRTLHARLAGGAGSTENRTPFQDSTTGYNYNTDAWGNPIAAPRTLNADYFQKHLVDQNAAFNKANSTLQNAGLDDRFSNIYNPTGNAAADANNYYNNLLSGGQQDSVNNERTKLDEFIKAQKELGSGTTNASLKDRLKSLIQNGS